MPRSKDDRDRPASVLVHLAERFLHALRLVVKNASQFLQNCVDICHGKVLAMLLHIFDRVLVRAFDLEREATQRHRRTHENVGWFEELVTRISHSCAPQKLSTDDSRIALWGLENLNGIVSKKVGNDKRAISVVDAGAPAGPRPHRQGGRQARRAAQRAERPGGPHRAALRGEQRRVSLRPPGSDASALAETALAHAGHVALARCRPLGLCLRRHGSRVSCARGVGGGGQRGRACHALRLPVPGRVLAPRQPPSAARRRVARGPRSGRLLRGSGPEHR